MDHIRFAKGRERSEGGGLLKGHVGTDLSCICIDLIIWKAVPDLPLRSYCTEQKRMKNLKALSVCPSGSAGHYLLFYCHFNKSYIAHIACGVRHARPIVAITPHVHLWTDTLRWRTLLALRKALAFPLALCRLAIDCEFACREVPTALEKLLKAAETCQKVVIFTGSGLSAASGMGHFLIGNFILLCF